MGACATCALPIVYGIWRVEGRDHCSWSCSVGEPVERTPDVVSTAQDEGCDGSSCACPCHGEAEDPGPHVDGCAWGDLDYEPRAAA